MIVLAAEDISKLYSDIYLLFVNDRVGGAIMTYRVKLIYGTYTDVIDITGVTSVQLETDVYAIYGIEGELLFTAPKETVVYIKQQ